jgi:serine/threonine-protein kinase
MPLNTGQLLQTRYRIVELLGQGGMGAVYRAHDNRLDISVAIKELLPQPGLDPEMLARLREQFLQEAKVLARLNHTHLVNVSDYFEQDGKAYLVMQYVEGESLAERIEREGALPEAQVIAWTEQILTALAYCHAQHILHRDIKPQNIVIQPDGNAVLVDFGLVKLWDPHDPRTHTVIRGTGTPAYAPPEQYDIVAGHTDARSDIYSLGATIYHALTGEVPPTATQRMVDPQALRPLHELQPEVSPRLERVVHRALEPQPKQRFQHAQEMAVALQGHDRPAPVSQPQRRAGWLWWGIGAVAFTALLIFVGVGAWPRPDESQTPTMTKVIENPTLTATEPLAASTAAVETTSSPPPAPTEKAMAAPTEEPSATLVPTITPQATATLAPTATPNPTVTPSCPTVQGPFAAIWAAEQARLGCAQGEAFSGLIAEETFEGGKMFWREPIDTAQALVLFNDGTWRIFTHAPYVEGSPEFPCADANTPAQCPPTPKRGFGTMWCDIPEIRNRLGNALDCERGYQGTLQQFDNGSVLRTDTSTVYLFYGDGTWTRR